MKLQMFVPVFHTFKCQHFFPASIFFVPVCSLFILMCAWTESELRVLLFAQRAPLNRLRGIQSQSSALVSTCQSLGELCRPCDNTYPPTPTQTREHGGGRGGGGLLVRLLPGLVRSAGIKPTRITIKHPPTETLI